MGNGQAEVFEKAIRGCHPLCCRMAVAIRWISLVMATSTSSTAGMPEKFSDTLRSSKRE
jgi:hypothetical protein